MDAEDLLGGLIRGALSGRRKSSRRTARAIGRGVLANPKTLIAAAGVAWGIYEVMKGQAAGGVAGPAAAPPPPPGSAVPPPLPGAGAPPGVSEGVLRLVRLTISAAGADGRLSPQEKEAILQAARKEGAAEIVEGEIANPRPLAEIVGGATDPRLKRELYALAFSIVRADEAVSGAERIYLAQLSHALGLGAEDVASIEAGAAAKIDAEAAN
jgi:uncharacterized membrane protein YebE (DUF533 family)